MAVAHDHSLGDGVYFQGDDYAGFIRRLVIITVDSVTLLVVGIAWWMVLLYCTIFI